MPGSMITELWRKRRASDIDEQSSVAMKRNKALPESSPSQSSVYSAQSPADGPEMPAKQSAAPQGIQVASDIAGPTATTKENRSPNLFMLEHGQADLDLHKDNQGASTKDQFPAPTDSAEGLVNLLLLADSSLQDTICDVSNELTYQETHASAEHRGMDAPDSEADGSAASPSQDFPAVEDQAGPADPADASKQHPTVASLRPRITAQTAALMSASIGMEFDSSSDEEEEDPTPINRHKGMGRYGQELGNIAAQAVRHTKLLKKKCANRTTKTVRHLRNASGSTCDAAEKAAEATRAADKAVQNLAAFADAFDDLVKEAVRSANAAAQARADYAASVVAAELAEARRDRVASKRGKRRSASPKSPKRLAWAVQEHLVQHRVFSKADPPSAASFNYAAAL